MNRREKVKDLVEVRSFIHLQDFNADPRLTIGSYHFTDATADLMGTWIDRIADLKAGRGSAFALAGLRGVGKSHFLAVLSSLASRPEDRSLITDPHILSRLSNLSKRPIPVVSVRRGSSETLMSELRSAISEAFSVNPNDLSDSLNDLLLKAYDLANGSRLIIFIDTEFGRESRVDRDDGRLLGEIADAARNIGILVGIALDDDVSGADGPNSSIAGSYHIDFLDEEHLYKIVGRHIFPKNDSMLPILKDIYLRYQAGIPGFRWSEQRFVPLYPLHPATLEISPLVRLFMQDFALLGFASEAGAKIMGRPADSLIGLDEMFRKVESNLRKAPQLESAFDFFDQLDTEIVQKSPVEFRLKARLILEGLFLLSLDGRGASAATIAASMMVFDEQDPKEGVRQVEELLSRFASEVPNTILVTHDRGSAPKFCLKIGIDDGLEEAIDLRRSSVTDDEVWTTLLQQISERFPEIQSVENKVAMMSGVTVEWRGGLRRGEVVWNQAVSESVGDHSDLCDWTITLSRSDRVTSEKPGPLECSLLWETAQLSAEEIDTISRYFVLKSHQDIRQKFGEDAAVTTHLLAASVDRISQRIFFDDAFLSLGDLRFPMQHVIEATHNLAHLFTKALTPVFDHLYPQHPYFLQSLGLKEVSHLTVNFFGRSDPHSPQTQNLAQLLAEPLGLSEKTSEGYLPATADLLKEIEVVRQSFGNWSGDGTLDLRLLTSRFKLSPIGLTREAQQLILTALVANREIDFVTTTGNRINHRSLDLQIIWDDVIGVARPAMEKYSRAQLVSWLQILTGDEDITSLDEARFKEKIDDGLSNWQSAWLDGKVLDNYEALSEASLNAASWRTASGIQRSLGAVAAMIDSYLQGNVTLNSCLESIADLFLGSQPEFHRKNEGLESLDEFINKAKVLEIARRYLSEADLTEDTMVERSRQTLIYLLERPSSEGDTKASVAAWEQFHRTYKSYYAARHEEALALDRLEAVRRINDSAEWQQFELYSSLSAFDPRTKAEIESLFSQMRDNTCSSMVTECLEIHPYCCCGFRLRDMSRVANVPTELRSLIAEGISSSMKTIDKPLSNNPASNRDAVLVLSASLAGFKA